MILWAFRFLLAFAYKLALRSHVKQNYPCYSVFDGLLSAFGPFWITKKSELENDAIKPYSAYKLISMPMHNYID